MKKPEKAGTVTYCLHARLFAVMEKPGTVTHFMHARRLFAMMGQPGNHDAGDAGHDLTLPSENPAVQPAIDGYNRLK